MPARFDKATLQSPELMPSGWLRADAYLTRTGIFSYQTADGGIRRELRLPDEVFAPKALASFQMVPLTNDHPPVPLDATNTKQYQVGHMGETVRRDGDFVAGRLLFTDAATIADIQAGKVELSCGYDCDLEMAPGSIEGAQYDAIQRNIRGNHVAVVDKGRAGPNAKIKMDSKDAYMVGVEGFKAAKKGSGKMEVTINGKKYTVTPELAAELEAMIAEEAAESPAEEAAEPGDANVKLPVAPPMPKGDRAGRLARITAERDQAIAERDAARSDKSREATAKADAAAREKIRAEVKARLSLEEIAGRVLGKKFVADGKSDRQIREAVIQHFDKGAKLEKESDTYVTVRFDLTLQSAGEKALADVREGTEGRGDAADDEPDDTAVVDIDKVRADSHKRTIDRGRTPLKLGTTKA